MSSCSDIVDCEDSVESRSDNRSLGDGPDDPKLARSEKSFDIYGGDKDKQSPILTDLSSRLTEDPKKDYCIEPNNLYIDCRVYMPN